MKNLFQLSLLVLSTLVVFSCKNKSADSAEVSDAAEVTTATGSEMMVSTADSKVLWKGSKPTGTHNGSVGIKEGTVTVANGEVTGGKVVLDMNTITVLDLEGDQKAGLEGHLKGMAEGKEDHFFNVAAHPTATFEITSVKGLEGNPNANKLVYGNLTMKGQTKQVGFPANITVDDMGVTVNAPAFTINRTDWGVNYNSSSVFDDLKDNVISDDIELTLSLSAKK